MNENFFEMMQNFLKNPANMEMLNNSMKGLLEKGKNITAEGSAGGDMVRATVNGSFELVSLTIDPLVVDKRDVAMLEQLVLTACRDAHKKIHEQLGAGIGSGLGGGLSL